MSLLRWCLRFAWLVVFVAMLAVNVATLTVSSVAALANGALAAAGVTTTAARSAARAAPARRTARAAARRVSTRVARGAARSAGSVVAQSVPFVGVAAVVGVTAWELSDACAMLDDLETLERALDEIDSAPGAAEVGAERDRVCGLQVPTREEVGQAIAAAPGEAMAEARGWLSAPPPAE